jgi:hypothetical protein
MSHQVPNMIRRLAVCLACAVAVGCTRSKPTATQRETTSQPRKCCLFETATIRPAAPLDMASMASYIEAGQMPKLGPHIDGRRAEYIYMPI